VIPAPDALEALLPAYLPLIDEPGRVVRGVVEVRATPLTLAALVGCERSVELLLRAGAGIEGGCGFGPGRTLQSHCVSSSLRKARLEVVRV
jgi:hypothetical protein